jgi:hypothetical protein
LLTGSVGPDMVPAALFPWCYYYTHEHSLTLLNSILKIEASRTSETSKTLSICTWCKDSREDSVPTVNHRKNPKLVVHSFPNRSFVILFITDLDFPSMQREVYCLKAKKQHTCKHDTIERRNLLLLFI